MGCRLSGSRHKEVLAPHHAPRVAPVYCIAIQNSHHHSLYATFSHPVSPCGTPPPPPVLCCERCEPFTIHRAALYQHCTCTPQDQYRLTRSVTEAMNRIRSNRTLS